jgi:hypothetical protein
MRRTYKEPAELAKQVRLRAAEHEVAAATVSDESEARYLKAKAQSFHILADAFSNKE